MLKFIVVLVGATLIMVLFVMQLPPSTLESTSPNYLESSSDDFENFHIRQNLHIKKSKFMHKPLLIDKYKFKDKDLVESEIKWHVSDYDEPLSDQPKCSEDIVFLVLITSSPEHHDRRDAIRKGWCNKADIPEISPARWQCIFMIGQTVNMSSNSIIKQEMVNYSDILRGSYMDSYRNLTYKVFHGYNWSSKYCRSNYVLKTDDDCFVNVRRLQYFLLHYNTVTTNLYAGNVFYDDEKRRVIRSNDSKWSVSKDVYPAPMYPPYASGVGYILSRDLADKMVHTSQYMKVVPNEDAFVGIIANNMAVKPIHSSRFLLFSSGLRQCNYFYLFIIHGVKAHLQKTMQDNAINAIGACNNDEVKSWH